MTNQPQNKIQIKQILADLTIQTEMENKCCRINTEEEEEEEAYRSPSADADTPRVWIENENENENDKIESSLILLDWDDTLFPTSMIVDILENRDENGFALVCDTDIELLNKLGELTLELLQYLISKYGSNNMHIVTNSLEGWIKNSLSFASCISPIYKKIELLLMNENITMDSAQSIYGKEKNSTPVIWKRLCFENILTNKSKYNISYKHFISIGDQWTDHQSLKQSMQSMIINDENNNKPIHHIIKLKMNPDLNDMINEMLYCKTCFSQMFDTYLFNNNNNNITPIVVDYGQEELKYLNTQ